MKGYKLKKSAVKRTAKVVREVERNRRTLHNASSSRIIPDGWFFAEITSFDSANSWYEFKVLQFDGDNTLADHADAITDSRALELNGDETVPAGTKVWMRNCGQDGSNNSLYAFFRPANLAQTFIVYCVNDGGSSGSDTTKCSYTYTLKDITNTYTLATTKTPKRDRPSIGPMATSSGPGIAYYDENGIIQLAIALNEVLDPETCP